VIYLYPHHRHLNLLNHHQTPQSDLLCESHCHQNSLLDQNPEVTDVLVQRVLPCAFSDLVQLKGNISDQTY